MQHFVRTLRPGCAVLRRQRLLRGSSLQLRRSLATRAEVEAMSDSEWTSAWTSAVSDVHATVPGGWVGVASAPEPVAHEASASMLRSLIQSNLLRFTDLQTNPRRFFEAHRILAARTPQLGPGFWIRFTVQYNLWAGSIVGLGDAAQVAELDAMQDRGALGCFCLTEKLAGVNSGMVANTVATYDSESGGFLLSTPSDGSRKNWISQGAVADSAVVVASLTDAGGVECGPTAFVMELRNAETGELAPGVHLEDMGRKTVGNDLDNVAVSFENVAVPRSALLGRYACVDDAGLYSATKDGAHVSAFAMVGQRLFTGRVAVAQAALAFSRGVFAETKVYSDAKPIWGTSSSGEAEVLSSVPQLRSLYTEAERRFTALDAFVAACEDELAEVLLANDTPDAALVEAIACAKVRAVEESIELCFRLKQEVGSYALMGGTAFEQLDFLQCCKFAEGDSRILMLKMARDEMRRQKGKEGGEEEDEAARLCAELSAAMEAGRGGEDGEWEKLYRIADITMERVTQRVCPEQ